VNGGLRLAANLPPTLLNSHKTMKISQIDIKDYNQFKNLTLDFTYPIGYPCDSIQGITHATNH
jgi:hypothetical protein